MTWVTVDVDIDDLDLSDSDIESLARNRGLAISDISDREILEKIYQARRIGQPYDQLLDELIWQNLGRM
jgi:hypothetical protein